LTYDPIGLQISGSTQVLTDTLKNPQSLKRDTTIRVDVQQERVELFTEISTLNPKKAAILSAVIPGLGQVYNKQYWKVPLIYGGGLIIAHYIRYNDRLYQSFRSSYLASVDADPGTVNKYPNIDQASLEVNAENLRRDRDYLMIIGGLFYLLQIVDAHVSAHLHEFTINEELSVGFEPTVQPSPYESGTIGVSFSLRMK